MCTAMGFRAQDFYFGRTLDYEVSFGEEVVITPRNFPLKFRFCDPLPKHYAMVGIGTIRKGYPLYYDAVNEKGLGCAGLNFPYSAHYNSASDVLTNIAPFELIPYILTNCDSVRSAVKHLRTINLADIPFSRELTASPLHWMFSDKERSAVVEPTDEGLKIYDNPTGVLTNEPPFPIQLYNLNNYIKLSAHSPENNFSGKLPLSVYSFGMGALGLPGDLSSASRFVRAVFTKENSVCEKNEYAEVSQFFHILGSVCQQRGCTHIENDLYEITRYSSCCNLDTGVYYYKTYENSGLTAVDMFREDLNSRCLKSYPLKDVPYISFQN